MDPNSIAQLLAHHPYHIDALLAMLELYRCVLERGTAPAAAAQNASSRAFALRPAWLMSLDAASCQHGQLRQLLQSFLFAPEATHCSDATFTSESRRIRYWARKGSK